MTHTIYRGRTRAGPDPVIHLQISERRVRELELQRLSRSPDGLRGLQLDAPPDENPSVSKDGAPSMHFDEVLQRTLRQKAPPRIEDSPGLPPNQEGKHFAEALFASDLVLTGRIPVIPIRHCLPMEDPVLGIELEERATVRVKPVRDVTP